MRSLRIWIKGLNQVAVDFPVAEDTSLAGILSTWKMDGFLSRTDGAGPGAVNCAIPWDSWLFCAIITIGSEQAVPSQPFEIFPTRKPN